MESKLNMEKQEREPMLVPSLALYALFIFPYTVFVDLVAIYCSVFGKGTIGIEEYHLPNILGPSLVKL